MTEPVTRYYAVNGHGRHLLVNDNQDLPMTDADAFNLANYEATIFGYEWFEVHRVETTLVCRQGTRPDAAR